MPTDENRPPIAPPLPTPAYLAEGFTDAGPFRYHFLRYFRAVLTYLFLIVGILLLLIWGTDKRSFPYMLLFLVVFTPPWALLSSWFYWRISETSLGHDGLRSQNMWSITTNVTWQEITEGKRIWRFFLFYLRVSTKQKRHALWLPLFLREPENFAESVKQFAPPDNPLRLYFEENPP